MGKVAVVYWSGTGNTEEMAKAVLEGAKKGGAEAELFTVGDFSADKMADYNGFLFGCPAMGDEVLEEDEFEPFFTEAEKKLSGVPVGLFGSYGWGGQSIQQIEDELKAGGCEIAMDKVRILYVPSEEQLKSLHDQVIAL